MKNYVILVLGLLGVFSFAIIAVSAQIDTFIFSIPPITAMPPNCMDLAIPSETDSGYDPFNPGVVRGTFFETGDPGNVIICDTFKDMCDLNDPAILWETVLGSSVGPAYASYAGMISVDCSSYNGGGQCHTVGSGVGKCGPVAPDLVVERVYVITPAPNLVIGVDVANNGLDSAPTSQTFLRILDSAGVPHLSSASTPAIAAGTFRSIQFTFTNVVASGNANIQPMYVDLNHQIAESNELNNLFNSEIIV